MEHDRFQLGLGPAATYMSPGEKICDEKHDISTEYEKCTDFEYKLLLHGLTKADVKHIDNVNT